MYGSPMTASRYDWKTTLKAECNMTIRIMPVAIEHVKGEEKRGCGRAQRSLGAIFARMFMRPTIVQLL